MWLGLAISIVCVIFVLNLLQRYMAYRSPIQSRNPENLKQKDGKDDANRRIVHPTNQYIYVLGNLLSQGSMI